MLGVTGLVASLTSLLSAECECGSMIPGVSHLPVASTTVADVGAFTVGPTSAILPACTQTDPFEIVPWLAVMTVAFLKTRSVGAACCELAAAPARATKHVAVQSFRVINFN